ncbi:MAG: 1-(5-phosphoribosyl)-5-[(5-phosphoribosylamino)methylideneamino] imidazole-4-carboxamide isomerase [Sphingosinicella sp.]|nr:1-(5-phosphoribosyl)-5-[(5-phosphoribosylamino)methylideneamino] imidazole-4-carboxamide isomerase [Sphingosinicella sp.]
MILYPAMDLMGGRVVRLRQGRFDEVTGYAANPADALADFAAEGAEWAHVVDLDGAKAGEPAQHALIGRLAREAKLKLQVGGGFRTREHVARMLDAGVERVVIGSLAIKQPERAAAFLDEFGSDRIILSLDIRLAGGLPIVVTNGWTEASEMSLWDAASLYPQVRHLLLTDIGVDGMLAGPNLSLLQEAAERLPHAQIQASGGVASLEDLQSLRTAGVIVGKALWEGRFTVAEALRAVA